jgi:hypothetical protein
MGARRVLRSRALDRQDDIDRSLIALQKAQRAILGEFTETAEVQMRHLPLRPEPERRYLPVRERSLHATVRHRAISKRRVSRRWGLK